MRWLRLLLQQQHRGHACVAIEIQDRDGTNNRPRGTRPPPPQKHTTNWTVLSYYVREHIYLHAAEHTPLQSTHPHTPTQVAQELQDKPPGSVLFRPAMRATLAERLSNISASIKLADLSTGPLVLNVDIKEAKDKPPKQVCGAFLCQSFMSGFFVRV